MLLVRRMLGTRLVTLMTTKTSISRTYLVRNDLKLARQSNVTSPAEGYLNATGMVMKALRGSFGLYAMVEESFEEVCKV